MIKAKECHLCGSIEEQPAGIAIAISKTGKPTTATLCSEGCLTTQVDLSTTNFDNVDIIRLGYGFPHEVVYGGLELWNVSVSPLGLRRFDKEVCVEVKCGACENYTTLPTYKDAVGRYFWPGTQKQFNGGAIYPYNVFADGRKNPKGGVSIKSFAACSHGCATMLTTELAFRPDGTLKRVIDLPKFVAFCDVFDSNTFGYMNLDTTIVDHSELFNQKYTFSTDKVNQVWEKFPERTHKIKK